jgi:NADH:ubiquinone oxidoreductase subunit 2 (subunit N)
VPLGVIAMVTAVIAAYFYLRLAVLMYAGVAMGDGTQPVPASVPSGRVDAPDWASPEAVSGTISTINAELLLVDEPAAPFGEETPSVVPVPALSALAIGLCVGVTVLFGVWPEPIVNFAHAAPLLFLGH